MDLLLSPAGLGTRCGLFPSGGDLIAPFVLLWALYVYVFKPHGPVLHPLLWGWVAFGHSLPPLHLFGWGGMDQLR